VQGAVTNDGRAGSFVVPEGTDIRALTDSLGPPTADRRARLLVRRDSAHGLRRHSDLIESRDTQEGWERVEVSYGASEALAEEVLSYADDVIVEEPPDLRSMVVDRLEVLAGASGGGTR